MDEPSDRIRAAARAMGKRRQSLLTADERRALATMAGKLSWSKMTPGERRIELKRRALIGKRTKAAKLRTRLQAVK